MISSIFAPKSSRLDKGEENEGMRELYRLLLFRWCCININKSRFSVGMIE